MSFARFRFAVLLLAPALAIFGQTASFDLSDWPMYNHDVLGARFNFAEYQLNRANVGSLKVKWIYSTAGDVYGTPAVVGNYIYAGDVSATFYALTHDGKLVWSTKVNAPITASALVTGGVIVFGDQAGYIYGLDRENGTIKWSVRPNPHPYAAIYGSAILANGQVVIGISSNEEALEGTPACCSFRGSVVSLDPTNGTVEWQTYLISDAESKAGASGASVWSTPTYDGRRIYVTTGNNYTAPATGTSDAFVALDPRTGEIIWVRQTVKGDIDNIDADFGDSPQVYTFRISRRSWAPAKKSLEHITWLMLKVEL
jgi:polyvinyl alcohol dehydrogenase (cytochrome)